MPSAIRTLPDYWHDPKQRKVKPWFGALYDDKGRPVEDEETTEDELPPTAPEDVAAALATPAVVVASGANGTAKPAADSVGADA